MLIRIFEVTIVLFGIYMSTTQILVPAITGEIFFPLFNKRVREAERASIFAKSKTHENEMLGSAEIESATHELLHAHLEKQKAEIQLATALVRADAEKTKEEANHVTDDVNFGTETTNKKEKI